MAIPYHSPFPPGTPPESFPESPPVSAEESYLVPYYN